ncbi:MAG: hypothetical protein AAF355_14880 [Myxococcota bacterium]
MQRGFGSDSNEEKKEEEEEPVHRPASDSSSLEEDPYGNGSTSSVSPPTRSPAPSGDSPDVRRPNAYHPTKKAPDTTAFYPTAGEFRFPWGDPLWEDLISQHAVVKKPTSFALSTFYLPWLYRQWVATKNAHGAHRAGFRKSRPPPIDRTTAMVSLVEPGTNIFGVDPHNPFAEGYYSNALQARLNVLAQILFFVPYVGPTLSMGMNGANQASRTERHRYHEQHVADQANADAWQAVVEHEQEAHQRLKGALESRGGWNLEFLLEIAGLAVARHRHVNAIQNAIANHDYTGAEEHAKQAVDVLARYNALLLEDVENDNGRHSARISVDDATRVRIEKLLGNLDRNDSFQGQVFNALSKFKERSNGDTTASTPTSTRSRLRTNEDNPEALRTESQASLNMLVRALIEAERSRFYRGQTTLTTISSAAESAGAIPFFYLTALSTAYFSMDVVFQSSVAARGVFLAITLAAPYLVFLTNFAFAVYGAITAVETTKAIERLKENLRRFKTHLHNPPVDPSGIGDKAYAKTLICTVEALVRCLERKKRFAAMALASSTLGLVFGAIGFASAPLPPLSIPLLVAAFGLHGFSIICSFASSASALGTAATDVTLGSRFACSQQFVDFEGLERDLQRLPAQTTGASTLLDQAKQVFPGYLQQAEHCLGWVRFWYLYNRHIRRHARQSWRSRYDEKLFATLIRKAAAPYTDEAHKTLRETILSLRGNRHLQQIFERLEQKRREIRASLPSNDWTGRSLCTRDGQLLSKIRVASISAVLEFLITAKEQGPTNEWRDVAGSASQEKCKKLLGFEEASPTNAHSPSPGRREYLDANWVGTLENLYAQCEKLGIENNFYEEMAERAFIRHHYGRNNPHFWWFRLVKINPGGDVAIWPGINSFAYGKGVQRDGRARFNHHNTKHAYIFKIREFLEHLKYVYGEQEATPTNFDSRKVPRWENYTSHKQLWNIGADPTRPPNCRKYGHQYPANYAPDGFFWNSYYGHHRSKDHIQTVEESYLRSLERTALKRQSERIHAGMMALYEHWFSFAYAQQLVTPTPTEVPTMPSSVPCSAWSGVAPEELDRLFR